MIALLSSTINDGNAEIHARKQGKFSETSVVTSDYFLVVVVLLDTAPLPGRHRRRHHHHGAQRARRHRDERVVEEVALPQTEMDHDSPFTIQV